MSAAEISLCASDSEAREERIAANLTFTRRDILAMTPLPGRIRPDRLTDCGSVHLVHTTPGKRAPWVEKGWYRFAANGTTYLIEVGERVTRPQAVRMFRPTIRGAA
jgi:hypothetical protein